MLLVIICLIYGLFGSNAKNHDAKPDGLLNRPVSLLNEDTESINTKPYHFPDLYSAPSNPPRPPRSKIYGNLPVDQIDKFWNEIIAENDRFGASNMPALDSTGSIYLMNYIFSPYDQLMNIFLLTKKPFGADHWDWAKVNDKYNEDDIPEIYQNIESTLYEKCNEAPPFSCVFRVEDTLWISKVDFVPTFTTIDSNINGVTDIMRCHVPMEEMQDKWGIDEGLFFDAQHHFEFLLTQKWSENTDEMDRVHISLSFRMGQRSGIWMDTKHEDFRLDLKRNLDGTAQIPQL